LKVINATLVKHNSKMFHKSVKYHDDTMNSKCKLLYFKLAIGNVSFANYGFLGMTTDPIVMELGANNTYTTKNVTNTIMAKLLMSFQHAMKEGEVLSTSSNEGWMLSSSAENQILMSSGLSPYEAELAESIRENDGATVNIHHSLVLDL
jgi:hypothetical protein